MKFDTGNDHSSNQLSVRQELTCPEGHSAWALPLTFPVCRGAHHANKLFGATWNEVGLLLPLEGVVPHSCSNLKNLLVLSGRKVMSFFWEGRRVEGGTRGTINGNQCFDVVVWLIRLALFGIVQFDHKTHCIDLGSCGFPMRSIPSTGPVHKCRTMQLLEDA